MSDETEIEAEEAVIADYLRERAGLMTKAQVFEACEKVAGFFTRPGDIAYLTDQVRAYGIDQMFHDSDRGVVVTYGANKHIAFTTGIEPLDQLIADLLGKSEQIAAAMLLMHAAREREWAESAHAVNEAIAKLEFRYGAHEGQPRITSEGAGPGASENTIGEIIWNHIHARRAGATFEHAKGTVAYEDTMVLASKIARGGR